MSSLRPGLLGMKFNTLLSGFSNKETDRQFSTNIERIFIGLPLDLKNPDIALSSVFGGRFGGHSEKHWMSGSYTVEKSKLFKTT